MSKRKTSINISDKLWRAWTKFTIDKTGSSRKTSEILEEAMKEYMERHKNNAENTDS
jgi:metal-responsive CopG/Arc/MetJ family transcriptional regulator